MVSEGRTYVYALRSEGYLIAITRLGPEKRYRKAGWLLSESCSLLSGTAPEPRRWRSEYARNSSLRMERNLSNSPGHGGVE
jgi:hypothetical protein